jgi:glycosyltransferase involved in cell wall biosynthesis
MIDLTANVIVHGVNRNLSFHAIGSVLAQTEPCKQLNILITDADPITYSLLKLYDEQTINGTKVTVTATKERLNCSNSKRFAAEISDTQYFCTLDADDYYHVDFFKYVKLEIEKGMNIISSEYVRVSSIGTVDKLIFANKNIYENNICHSGSIIRKEAYNEVGGYQIAGYEDYLLWISLYKHNPARFVVIPKTLYFNYKWLNNISSKFDIIKESTRVKNHIKALNG